MTTLPPAPEPQKDPPPAPETSLPALERPLEPAPSPLPTSEPEDLTGRVINNNYRILRLIGRGGMGEVYEGVHLFTENRIAIKMVLQSLSRDPQILALFKREARTLFRLTDESIARYLDSVHDPVLDRYCLIMDYIDGVHLSDYVAQHGAIDPLAARGLMQRLARGLDRAHQLGIIHRDLSPDNVMLRDGDLRQAVLIDFGIARSEQSQEATLFGQLAGKFKYISPEQLGHFNGEVGPRTDVYGLGLLMAMALRGKPIDMGNSVVAAVEARRRIPPLDGVPAEFVPILSQMLEPDPMRRPAGMSEVLAMLAAREGRSPPDRTTAVAESDRTVLISAPLFGAPAAVPAEPSAEEAQRTVIVAPPGSASLPLTIPPPAGPPSTGTTPPVTGGSWSNPQGMAQPLTAEGFAGLPQATLPPQEGEVTGDTKPRLLQPNRWSIGLLGAVAIVACLIAYRHFATPTETEPAVVETEPEVPPPSAVARLPAPDPTTREGLLAAEMEPAACAYATRITAGGNARRLEVFGTDPARSEGISGKYRDAFGIAPGLVNREVSAPQCAALDFLRALQGRAAPPPLLTLDTDRLSAQESLIGRLSDTRGRVLWLFLVSASGAVHNLSSRLEGQADGSWLFSFGVQSLSGKEEPQLLVAVATEAPLVNAAAAPAGVQAELLLPKVLEEIAKNPDRASAQAGYFLLVP